MSSKKKVKLNRLKKVPQPSPAPAISFNGITRKKVISSILVLFICAAVALQSYNFYQRNSGLVIFYINNYLFFIASAFVGLSTAFTLYYRFQDTNSTTRNNNFVRRKAFIIILNLLLAIPSGIFYGNYSLYKERKELVDEVSKIHKTVTVKINQTSTEWAKEGIGVSWPSHNPWPLYLSDQELSEIILDANKINRLASKFFTENVTVYLEELLVKLSEPHIGTFVLKTDPHFPAISAKHSFTEKEVNLIRNLLMICQDKMLNETSIFYFPKAELIGNDFLAFPSKETTNEYYLTEFAGKLNNTLKRKTGSLYLLDMGYALFMTGREERGASFLEGFTEKKHLQHAGEWDEFFAYTLLYKYYTYPAPSSKHGPDKNKATYYVKLGESSDKDKFYTIFNTFKKNHFYDENGLKYYYNVE